MTVGRFARFQAIATRLLTRYGEKSTYRRRVVGEPSPTTPWLDGTLLPPTEKKVDAAWFDYDVSRVDGTLVRQGDVEVFVSAKQLNMTPEVATDQLVRVNGQVWTIVRFTTIAPNEDLILYIFTARL